MLLKQNLITEMNLVIGQQPQQKRSETTTFVEEMGEDVEVVQEGKEGGVAEDSKVNVDLILKKRSVLESLSKSLLSASCFVICSNLLAILVALY